MAVDTGRHDPLDRAVELHRRHVEAGERSKGALVHRNLAIREAVHGGSSVADVARALGMTVQRVHQIIRNPGTR